MADTENGNLSFFSYVHGKRRWCRVKEFNVEGPVLVSRAHFLARRVKWEKDGCLFGV
jgi:hypothetical protein